MPEIRRAAFNFPRLRGNGPQTATQVIVFAREVERATAGITGYSMGFAGEDHHVGNLDLGLEATITANVVEVRAHLGVRDWSGNWDDDYAGTITAAVLADLVSVTAPPTRGDLSITGLEVNQAIQSFRSAEHLDAANVLPDNAIRLVGGKITGLRLWVDYDADAGLPAITDLSGEVTVRSGAATQVITATTSITPRSESEIDRGQADHTLNFRLLGELCRGVVDIEARVFDAANPTMRSAALLRTLRFVDVNPVRVYGVGIRYTGQSMDLAAPSETDMLDTLDKTRRLFPTGDVLLSGFTTIDFGTDMRTTDTSGCGDGFEDLNGKLRDMKGDSDDLFYGLLPNGVLFGNFSGCGGGGVGSGMVGAQGTTAHECGHAFGRQHAPCDSTTRCRNPSNQDGSYPRYGTFVSDSIGEYGYDPIDNAVFDPASAYDVMGYSSPRWISPYTYRALYARMDAPAGFATSGESARAAYALRVTSPSEYGAWRPSRPRDISYRPPKQPRLFLRIEVHRGRRVVVEPAFTFEARERLDTPGGCGQYTVEILDDKDEVIACDQLVPSCMTCRSGCWPRHLLGEVAYDPSRAARLALYHHDDPIHEADIGEPPRLECEKPKVARNGDVTLTWDLWRTAKPQARKAKRPAQESAPRGGEAVAYMVQWEDEDGTWRGLAPRMTERSIVVPVRLRRGRQTLRARVLATSGLATSNCEWELEGTRSDPPVRIYTSEYRGGLVRAWAIDHLGRTLPNAAIGWYDDRGGELGRGAELDMRQLEEHVGLIRAVAINAGAGKAEREISVGTLGTEENKVV